MYNAAQTGKKEEEKYFYDIISKKVRAKWTKEGIKLEEIIPSYIAGFLTFGRYTSSTIESFNHCICAIRRLGIDRSLLELYNNQVDIVLSHKKDSENCKGELCPRSGTRYLQDMEKSLTLLLVPMALRGGREVESITKLSGPAENW